MITIVNYGAGNLKSVKKAFNFLGEKTQIIDSPDKLDRATKIVLPGVGAFGSAIKNLKQNNLFMPIKKWLDENKPLLGICLGMQLLFEESEEAPGVKGFGLLKGRFKKFTKGKTPQIGWNQVKFSSNSRFFEGIKNKSYFYFVHSFYIQKNSFLKNNKTLCSNTFYYIDYISAIEHENMFGVQFHPEKSGQIGVKLLQNWVSKC